MSKKRKLELAALYNGGNINEVWHNSRNLKCINHKEWGKISPNQLRAKFAGKPCPFCGKKMTHGSEHRARTINEAVTRGYQYTDANGKEIINKVRVNQNQFIYFHPHYASIDHKLNKARFPERMFDADNLQVICWACNTAKSDNNAFELQHDLSYIQDLGQATLDRYPVL
ncbi:hypothetical protein HRE53_22840 [Acaryochloris sp. 'Moss Beach']|uniref:hypothetical protein n=1 Tax=Acaryochloris sp. 'Moss Beach' TaxID=2740837 RepID=UPI001F264806|nr:hypothetical protein [Acaryochloris sp. 'Moss Beach']UJB69192.1 hypothetical protein HRE53_22840 [Acaryochloris sp. 'Moss Beach']